MSTYTRPQRNQSKKKKYRLKNPKRFFGFLIVVLVVILLFVFLLKACGNDSGKTGNSSASGGESSAGAVLVTKLGDLQKQTVAWTAGLINMTRGISTVPQDEPVNVPKLYTIVIDPGCGGTDSGNPGQGTIVEKAINLDVALKLQAELEKNYPQIRVVMTRNSDTTVDTDTRIRTINEAGADLAISLHCDYFAGSSARSGVTTYYRQSSESGSQESSGSGKEAGIDSMSRQIAETLQKKAAEALESEDRGTAQERYEILNSTTAPTVLMEMAYLTDAGDYAKITDSSYQNSLASSLAEGIHELLASLYPNRTPDSGNSSMPQDSSAADSSAGNTR